MSQPEVKDITFDRPDYTAGSYIVFVGQNYEVAPPGPYWARKAYNKVFISGVSATVGTSFLALTYTPESGKTLFITDFVVINTGRAGGGDPRYPTTGYWYHPSTIQTVLNVWLVKNVGTQEIDLDEMLLTPYHPSEHRMYQTPLVFNAGETMNIYAQAWLGNCDGLIIVEGYETTP